jgi:hypothetical protein
MLDLLTESSSPKSVGDCWSKTYALVDAHRIIDPQRLRAKSGAAFGATLYCNFVLFCAT